MSNPLTEEDLEQLVKAANNGWHPKVYLVWSTQEEWIVTSIKLKKKTTYDGPRRLSEVTHNWIGRDSKVLLESTFGENPSPRHYLFDNYWLAYGMALRLKQSVPA